MEQTYQAVADIFVLPNHEPAGALGFLPIHAFLIKGSEPILVETSLKHEISGFLDALRGEMDLEDLAYVIITHDDGDHAGNVSEIMRLAPRARLVMSFLTMLKLAAPEISPDRIVIATAGERLVLGDRTFGVLRPPVYDSSGSLAFYDERTGTLFSADAFGGLVPHPTADAASLGPALEDGCATFTLANTSWLHLADPAKLADQVSAVRSLDPKVVLTAHAAPLKGRTARLCDHLLSLPGLPRVEFPNNAAFRQIVAQMKAAGAPPETPATGDL